MPPTRTFEFEGRTVSRAQYFRLKRRQRERVIAAEASQSQAAAREDGLTAAALDRITCYLDHWEQNVGARMASSKESDNHINSGQRAQDEQGNHSPLLNNASLLLSALDTSLSPSLQHISSPFNAAIHAESSSDASPECTLPPFDAPIQPSSSDESPFAAVNGDSSVDRVPLSAADASRFSLGSFGSATVSSLFGASRDAENYLPPYVQSADVQQTRADEDDPRVEAKEKLRKIFVMNGATKRLQNSVLKFIRDTPAEILKSLPLNHATLGQSTIDHDRYNLRPGELIYFGVRKLLTLPGFTLFRHTASTIHLSVSVDGVPIFMSPHGIGTWPISASVDQYPVFLVGYYCGTGKPVCPNAFMRPLVHELRALEDAGFSVPVQELEESARRSQDDCSVRIYTFRLHKLIFDAPALSYITCIAGHAAEYACPKCKQPGESVALKAYGVAKTGNQKRGVRYATSGGEWEDRTHDDFILFLKYVVRKGYNTGTAVTDCCAEYSDMRLQCGENPEVDEDPIFEGIFDEGEDDEDGSRVEQEQLLANECYMDMLTKHHYQKFRAKTEGGNPYHVSIFCTLRHFDMVKDVVIDYMHTFLGVVKTMLTKLTSAKGVKMTKAEMAVACERLILCSKYHPKEFQRKPETLFVLPSWKATQARGFGAYYAPVVLRDTVSPELFENFCMLVHALRILLCRVDNNAGRDSVLRERADVAEPILRHFVDTARALYGAEIASIKVHQLPHIVRDYVRFGPLDGCSAFPYESFSGSMKKLVRGHKEPATQIINQISDLIDTRTYRDTGDRTLDSLREYYEQPVLRMPYKASRCASANFFKCGKSVREHPNDARYYKRLFVRSYVLGTDDDANSCCLINGDTYFKIREIFTRGESATVYLCGNIFELVDSLYTFQIPYGVDGYRVHDSKEVGMVVGVLSIECRCYEFGSVSQKVCAVPLQKRDCYDSDPSEERYALAPFLH